MDLTTINPMQLYCTSIEEAEQFSLEQKIELAHRRIETAINQYKPKEIIACCSGGHDSRTITHLTATVATRLQVPWTVFHIDTGIKVIDAEYDPEIGVRNLCQQFGWPLEVYRALEHISPDGHPDPQDYESLVLYGAHGRGKFGDLSGGFPGPGMHQLMFTRLKGRQIERMIRDKVQDKENLLLVTGVRLFESERRWESVSTRGVYQAELNYHRVWVSAIAEWTGLDTAEYMKRHNIPKSALKSGFCHSGECLCNAFGFDPVQIEFLKTDCPKTWEKIQNLEARSRELGYPWGWNEKPPQWWASRAEIFDSLSDSDEVAHLCTSCISRHEENNHLKETLVLPTVNQKVGPPTMDDLMTNLALPTIPGIQAGKKFYATVMTLDTIASLTIFDESVVPDESLKAQRPLSESRLPKIANYMTGDWVFDSITVALEEDCDYRPLSQDLGSAGILLVPRRAVWRIVDGQHRAGGIRLFVDRVRANPDAAKQSVSVNIFVGADINKLRQMFKDLNFYAARASKSLAVAYDGRERLPLLTQAVYSQIPVFNALTDCTRSSLPARSSKLFCLSHLMDAVKILSSQTKETRQELIVGFWQEVANQIDPWDQVLRSEASAKSVRESFVSHYSVVLNAIALVGVHLYQTYGNNWLTYLKLDSVNWRANNTDWTNLLYDDKGAISKTTKRSVAIRDYILSCSKS